MDSPKTNGSTAVHVSSNGISSPHSEDRPQSADPEDKQWPDAEKPKGSKVKRCFLNNTLTLLTLLGVVVGISLGLVLRSFRTWTKREIMYVNFPGELFLNMLTCLILPLIVSSLVAAIGSLDTKLTGKIGIRAVAYYMLTTILAIILGIILVITIKPGANTKLSSLEDRSSTEDRLPEDTLMDLVRNLFPKNLIDACIRVESVVLEKPAESNKTENGTQEIKDIKQWDFKYKKDDKMNILGLVVFSIVLGFTLASMKKKGRPLLDVFICLSDAIMIITRVVIWLSPVGILFLIASKMLEMEDIGEMAGQIGYYTITVLCGVCAHGFIVLPLIYFLLTRKNPIRFTLNMGQALATAFGTASSSATLPVTINCLEEKNSVDHRVARFVLPIGATINMDGTALYEAVAAIFIAQYRGVSLSVGQVIAISITSTAASIGAAGIPQAGLVTMVMVLNVVGLPAEDVSLILIVDWMLDRVRTMINVLGDAFGAGIVAHYSKKDLEEAADDVSNLEMTTL